MASQTLPELTLRVIILSIILTLILAMSNTYLALKIGVLTSASIPAAVMSMGILRLFKDANILENNLVQTAASAGEAVAGGIAYTIPALVIIHYWTDFSYWENFFIAFIGGSLGVFFSVPLRRALMSAEHLHFPEGKATAEILRVGMKKAEGLKQMLWGGTVGAFLELTQTGFKVIAAQAQFWVSKSNVIFGFGGGFSATLIGAGYIIGFQVGLSIFIGALLSWGLGIPVLSALNNLPVQDAAAMVSSVYREKIAYMGIGGMLLAGLWTLSTLVKTFYQSIYLAARSFAQPKVSIALPRTERDLPLLFIILGIIVMLVGAYYLFIDVLPIHAMGFNDSLTLPIVIGCLAYLLIIGFIFSAICGYFSGLVGVAASPGSAIVIAGVLFAALLLRMLMQIFGDGVASHEHLLNGAAITIIVAGLVTGAAAIANDNIQDLKVGQIVGATPWKQQVMLLLGVLVAAAIIPWVMQLLFHVYGIADVLPHAGADPNQTLAAPPAAAMAVISQGVFNHDLPWDMLGVGAGIIAAFILLNTYLGRRKRGLSLLGIAMGMYLPLSSSIPLFIGACITYLSESAMRGRLPVLDNVAQTNRRKNLLLACGLVSGAALMDVILAIPMAMSSNANLFNLLPKSYEWLSVSLSFLTVFLIASVFRRTAIKS